MKFKSGNYYIGDLCYVIKDELWSKFCDEWFKNKGFRVNTEVTINGIPTFCDGTAYGDGSYSGNKAKSYSVDSGSIGIVEVSKDSLADTGILDAVKVIGTIRHGHGHIHTFYDDFEVSAENGVFKFGSVKIDTEDYSDEYDEEDDDEY